MVNLFGRPIYLLTILIIFYNSLLFRRYRKLSKIYFFIQINLVIVAWGLRTNYLDLLFLEAFITIIL
jgi:hypothetical protein